MSTAIKFHEIADLFPLLEGSDLDALVADIKANGLWEPIWTLDGKILDGRNRARACELAHVEPRFRSYTGDDPLAFVISMNLARRHLDAVQRADVADALTTLGRGGDRTKGPNGPSLAKAAELMHVGRKTVQRFRIVKRHGSPELLADVKAGRVPLAVAAEKVCASQKTLAAITTAPSEGMRIARTAMGKLNKIRIDDLELEQAQAFCKNWIEAFCLRIPKRPKKTAKAPAAKKSDTMVLATKEHPYQPRTKRRAGKRAEYEAERKAELARMKAMKPGDITVRCKVCWRIFTAANPCPDHEAPKPGTTKPATPASTDDAEPFNPERGSTCMLCGAQDAAGALEHDCPFDGREMSRLVSEGLPFKEAREKARKPVTKKPDTDAETATGNTAPAVIKQEEPIDRSHGPHPWNGAKLAA